MLAYFTKEKIMKNNQSIPLLDLKAQFENIEGDIRDAIDGVLQSQNFIMGSEVEKFEDEVASYSNVRHGIGVSSGTDALLVSLMGLGIKPGDEVVTTAYSFFATAGAISRLGAKPVFVDVEQDSLNINPSLIEQAFTPKTKAIIPVHLFGQCAEMDSILDISKRNGVPVIEDAAQSIGSIYKGRHAGSIGYAGCLSFFPSKNLGGYGDGGMVLTNDDEFAEKVRILRVHGSSPKYFHKIVGGNFRLDALQAAILRVKLKHLDLWNIQRRKNANLYNKKISESGIGSHLLSTPIESQETHIYHQYVIRTSYRDALQSHLRENGIGCQVYFPLPLHLQSCFEEFGYEQGDFPISEAASAETIAIPVYPELTEEQIDYVVSVISDFFRNR